MSKDSKAPIEEKDINNYAQVMEKINKRIGDTFRTLPENLVRPVPGDSQLLVTPDKSATPFSRGGLISASGLISGAGTSGRKIGSTASPGAGGLDFLKGILGGQDLTKFVEEEAKTQVAAIDNKRQFVEREEQRLRFLEEDKLISMKNIMAYEKEDNEFGDL